MTFLFTRPAAGAETDAHAFDAAQADGFDSDRALAEHLLFDCGEDTDLVRRYFTRDQIAAALTGR